MSNIGNKEIFAANLKSYIEKSGRTQRELSEIAGVATSTFNDWVKAKKYPRIDKIEILANCFGIKKSDLIEEKVTEKIIEKGDIAADITIRLGKDVVFLEVVKRNFNDKEFLELSKELCQLDTEQIVNLRSTLRSLLK